MACLVSTSFAVPLRSSSTLLLLLNKKGVRELDFALTRLSKKATNSTVQKILGSRRSNKHIVSVKGRSCKHCLMSFARFLPHTCTYKGDVDYCTEVVISGYWVGPDVDDGWGFVEAVIDQMT